MNNPKKSGDKPLLRLSENGKWEVWSIGDGGQARMARVCDTPVDAQVPPHSILALPLRQLFALPLWLATTDPALMREMIFLQLERRGLAAGRTPEEVVFDHRIVATVENKTLVLAVALPGSLPAELCPDLRSYEPSARLLPLPSDEFVFWREGGGLVLAVTRGEELVYFQALGDAGFTVPVLQELQCIRMQLEAENAIGRINGITLLGEFTPQEISSIGGGMDLRVTAAPQPAPVLPRGWMELVPAGVRQVQHAAQTRGRSHAILLAAAGFYLLLLSCLVARVAWLGIEKKRITSDLKAHEDEVNQIVETSGQWDALSPAIDRESYPAELLLRCAQLLPAQGVRFTLFGTGAGKIIIQGEAANATQASNFGDALKQSNDLKQFTFDAPTPSILPNGSTKFQIEGALPGAITH